MLERELSEVEVRVLGCLVEKKVTTPDQYPLTENSARLACNQKTSRWPVTDYTEGEVGRALRDLMGLGLVTTQSGARAMRYEHRIGPVLEITRKEIAALTALMLRGPQTAAEVRSHAQRLYTFDDADDAEFVLDRLTEREPPLAWALPRQPGQKEGRYVHGLCGEPDLDALPAAPVSAASSGLSERVSELETTVAELGRRLDALEGRTD